MVLLLLASIWVAWNGFGTQTMGDYPNDYAPAMNALLGGHAGAFFHTLPTNGAGGSLLLRAPAALIAKLLEHDQRAIFRFGAAACILTAAGVGLALACMMRRSGRPVLAQAAVAGLFVLTPGILDAIRFGHPEEALGAALCVAAVLLASGGREGWAAVALGLAVINKPWGVLAISPVLLAAPRRQVRVAMLAGAIALAWTAAAYIGDSAHFARIVLGASTSVVAHPVDLWWPLARLHTVPGVTPAYFSPAFVSEHARELAVLLAVPLAIPLARRRGRSPDTSLALLALLFLARCMLDPSNHVYYQVPCVLALAAWEARTRGIPVLALSGTFGFWLVFHTISGTGSLTAQWLAYLAITVPLAAVLTHAVFRAPGRAEGVEPTRALSLA